MTEVKVLIIVRIDIEEVTGIDNLHHHRQWLYSTLNKRRLSAYENKEKVFGLKRSEDIPIKSSPLPESDQFAIAQDNATQAWQPAIWGCIRAGTTAPIENNPCIQVDEPEFVGGVKHKRMWLEPDEQTNEYIECGPITVVFSEPVTEDIILENGVSVHYSEEDMYVECTTEDEDNESTMPSFIDSDETIEIAYSLAVAGGAMDVMQVEVSNESSTFPELFDDLGLRYVLVKKAPTFNTYLITHSERGEERIRDYISGEEYTIEEYTKLLGIPDEVSYFVEDNIDKYSADYDRYPSEEAAVQLFEQDEDFSASELQAFALCPYRVPPTPIQVRYASQLGKQIMNALTEFQRVGDEYDIAEVVQEFERHQLGGKIGRNKPVFPVKNWPLKPDESVIEEVQEHHQS